MGADLIAELPTHVTPEDVAAVMQDAAGAEVSIDRHEEVACLAGRMVTLTAGGVGRITYHVPSEDTPDAVTILGRSFGPRLAFARRLVERFGGRLRCSDWGFDGTFDLVLHGPLAEAEQRRGPLTPEEVAWGEEHAAYKS